MTVECITCDRLSLRDNPAFAKLGLGRCSQRPRTGVFVSIAFARDCAKHAPASDKTQAARRAWMAKKGRA
ncbi:hypothetical protein [Aquabacterium sp.]|uniref:hypothetical protein n=1 Tax=Aquabacterium sp. TaxID=1872578 RepID=UPI0035B444BA